MLLLVGGVNSEIARPRLTVAALRPGGDIMDNVAVRIAGHSVHGKDARQEGRGGFFTLAGIREVDKEITTATKMKCSDNKTGGVASGRTTMRAGIRVLKLLLCQPSSLLPAA